jgi:hypothetical protein
MVPGGYGGCTIGWNIFTSASMGKIFENLIKIRTTELKKFKYLQGDLMAIKESNFECVYMRNISQYDSGERCGPWASCMYERSYGDFAHPSELEIIDTTDRMFHICFIFRYSCEIGWSQQTKDSTIWQMGRLQFLFSTFLSILYTCLGDRAYVRCDCSTKDACSS